MNQVKTCLYLIEFKDGSDDVLSKEMLQETLDDIFDTISKIVKQYRLHGHDKIIYRTTLFTCDYDISADDYIEHYSNLPKDKYGPYVLDDFDIEIIRMFN